MMRRGLKHATQPDYMAGWLTRDGSGSRCGCGRGRRAQGASVSAQQDDGICHDIETFGTRRADDDTSGLGRAEAEGAELESTVRAASGNLLVQAEVGGAVNMGHCNGHSRGKGWAGFVGDEDMVGAYMETRSGGGGINSQHDYAQRKHPAHKHPPAAWTVMPYTTAFWPLPVLVPGVPSMK